MYGVLSAIGVGGISDRLVKVTTFFLFLIRVMLCECECDVCMWVLL